MSTFSGFFDEIPNISADCFCHENLYRSKLFFLSHCHTDHMKGLWSGTHLPGPLYASEITTIILRKKYPNITDIRTLEIDISYELEVPDKDGTLKKLVVTTLPAYHCPGSVMFLFETDTSTILYTGDFRLSKQNFKKLYPLADKKIDVVYLDSTFLDERFQHFPHQMESVKMVVSLADEWLRIDEDRKVLIETPAHYGYEYLFMELGKRLGCKIHVDQRKWEEYVYIPAMDNYISQNESECRIFTVLKRDYHLLRTKRNARLIVPTAFFWQYWKEGDPIYKDLDWQGIRVPLSNHSSLTEIQDFLEYIQPGDVKMNVLDENDKQNREQLLENMLRNIRKENVCSTDELHNLTKLFNSKTIFTLPRSISSQSEEKDCSKESKFKTLPKRKRR